MASTNTASAAAPTTPPIGISTARASHPATRTIQPSPDRPHVSPASGGTSSRGMLSPTHAMPIRRRSYQAAVIDTTRLFNAVRQDNADAVMRLLAGTMDGNVRHPETGETVIFTAARCGARRVVNSLLHDDSREVVDEPVGMQCADGTLHEVRATDVAAAHARAFSSASMSLWHLVQQQIELHESSGKERFKSGLRGLSHAHTRRASGDARTSPPLEDKEALLKRLDEMIERIRPLIQMRPTAESGAAPGEKESEFLGCDVKAFLKQEREALQTLRPALQRWSDFIRQLIEIGARPLPSPHVKPGTLHDPATLDREGELEPLLESLKRRSPWGQDADDATSFAAATKALNAAMERSTRAGVSHRPSQQQVLLAQSYFERLPDDLLHDRFSMQRHLHSVLELADETHGGRPALVEKMASALQAFDELTQATAHTRKLYQGVSYSTGDPRADTQALAVQVNNKIREAKSQERQALAIVRSACAGASPRIDDWLQQAAALRAEADAVPSDAQAATALRSRAEELEAKADALDGSRVRATGF